MNKWYTNEGSNSDVVISSKINLKRNLKNIPFPIRMSDDLRKSTEKRIFATLKNSKFAGEFNIINVNELSDANKFSLAEKGLISYNQANNKFQNYLIITNDESVSISLFDDEHISLSVNMPGEDLKNAYKIANEIDNVLLNNLEMAFDNTLGFLTSNPTILGTAMRTSLFLHLPAINKKNMIPSLKNMISKLGFSLIPMFKNSDFFELSNEITLGISEKSSIENLSSIAQQIIKQERMLRNEMINYDNFEDLIFRALGTLKMARQITFDEFIELISYVRLGVYQNLFNEPFREIDDMIYSLGNASIIASSDKKLDLNQVNKIRADYVRENL